MPLIRKCQSCGKPKPGSGVASVRHRTLRSVQGPASSGRRAHRSQRGRIPAGHPRQQSSRPGGFLGRWCGPCRRAAPHVAQTARDLAGRAVVLKVDTEKFSALAAQYNVRGIPNFAVFSHGRLVFQLAGRVDAATMQHWLTRAA